MKSDEIIIKTLPKDLKDLIVSKQLDEVIHYFIDNNIEETKYAYILSSMANQYDTVEYHEMAGSIFHIHFNYIEEAYYMAFYHYWQSLEITNFNNAKLLEEFLDIIEEPDFDIISEDYIKHVAKKLLENDPSNPKAKKLL
ncbi:hypothetical protein ACFDHY_06705 [Staphylococcus hyicus]|uniref:hypothetical protein n=1 Tax=Staphylococcus hyicus TaxID=1284 RepID=UPI002738A3AF|nr:hypothetical protein [Staphylococcus hyicus]MDP4448307.1 hypothetical protein [Staphylococcus hyicus]MDP4459777.1 hypothetical protein [Staphylococcus hyicus]MDP4468657.1 hypothetical protein [Staphylococcus hyicus]MDY3698805.1 hypothetical protein [Staphylococcus hyicus]